MLVFGHAADAPRRGARSPASPRLPARSATGRLEVRTPGDGSARGGGTVGRRFNAMLDTLAAQRRSIEDGQARLLSVLNNVQEVVYSGTPSTAAISIWSVRRCETGVRLPGRSSSTSPPRTVA
ncbi:MAG: hypothetical protein MZW92_01000 [Comamonadaceae bacterium]|nr:hypothetical protein [Comamonadaceae bacterium]